MGSQKTTRLFAGRGARRQADGSRARAPSRVHEVVGVAYESDADRVNTTSPA